ncbi:hypothetical protein NQZ68_019826 [Dissostichus eleginoides]|nr:hypothetical protein NQZ68_019826 [Dissostichus eleginoides]
MPLPQPWITEGQHLRWQVIYLTLNSHDERAVGREAGWRLRRGRSSPENQLHSPGGLEVNAPTLDGWSRRAGARGDGEHPGLFVQDFRAPKRYMRTLGEPHKALE